MTLSEMREKIRKIAKTADAVGVLDLFEIGNLVSFEIS